MSRTKITLDEWEQALADAMGCQVDSVPKDWITLTEFGRRINKSSSTASRDMRLLLSTGAAESKRFRVEAGSRIIPVPHYRLKK